MWASGVRHVRLAWAGGVPEIPKHHLFLHLLYKTPLHGNPRYYATLTDESVNRQLAGVARSAYAAVWERRILFNMDLILDPAHGLHRRR